MKLGNKVRALTGMALMANLVGAALAQDVTFDPVVVVSYNTTDNLGIEDESGNQLDDAYYTLGFTLPVTKDFPRGSFTASYSPQFERFQDFSQLDNTGHTGSLSLDTDPSELTTFVWSINYSKSLDQGGRGPEIDPDLTITQPIIRETIGTDLTYTQQVSQRWNWAVGASYQDNQFDQTDITEIGGGELELEDRTAASIDTGFFRDLSPVSSGGFRYDLTEFDLEVSGSQTVHSFLLTYDRSTSAQDSFHLELGGFSASNEMEVDDEGNDSREDFRGLMEFSREGRNASFNAVASQEPSAGGTQQGTATTRTLSAVFSNPSSGSTWDWSIGASWFEREAVTAGESDTETQSVTVSLGRALGRYLRAGVSGVWSDQETDAENVELFRGGIFLEYSPLEGTRWAGGGSTP